MGKRRPLNMRTTDALRSKLDAAVKVSGRSLCAEVEFRVESSFLEDSIIKKLVEAMKK